MDPEFSLRCSQGPVTNPIIPLHTLVPYFHKIHSDIIFRMDWNNNEKINMERMVNYHQEEVRIS